MAEYLGELGAFLADVPYVAYHNMDMQNLDVEIGFPLSEPLPEKGEIQAGAIPAGKFIFCMYQGAYGEMEPVYAEMGKWIEDHHLTATGVTYEHYYNGPEFPEKDLLTMVVLPLHHQG